MTRSDKARVSKQIIRTWFDSVLTPMIQGLDEVEYLLKKRNLTWKRFYRDFEDIKTLEGYVHYEYMPNYEQIVMTKFPELQEIVTAFDQKRAELSAACGKLFDSLINDASFTSTLHKAIESLEKVDQFESGSQIDPSDIEYLKGEKTNLIIAEYLINNTQELDYGNTFRPLWNYHREEFFRLLSGPSIQPVYINFESHFEEFQKVAMESKIRIKEFVNTISLNYGIPIVELKNR
ncbi:MAG: hypothetical protein ACM3U1_09155 [Chloroflexota bacterium]